jgi:hypothetical protein
MRHGEEIEFLEDVADRRLRMGKPEDVPAAIRERPRLFPGNEAALRAWQVLDGQRQVGFAANALSLGDVESWMGLVQVPDHDRAPLLAGILACDRGWRQVQVERSKREEPLDGGRTRP